MEDVTIKTKEMRREKTCSREGMVTNRLLLVVTLLERRINLQQVKGD